MTTGINYIYNLEIVMLLLLINLIIYIYYFKMNYNRTYTKHYTNVMLCHTCYNNLLLFFFLWTNNSQSFATKLYILEVSFKKQKEENV